MRDLKNYFSKARVETFSDGVFAIIVTLLVLEIKVPHIESHNPAELSAALLALVPKFLSWVISFFTVCVIWVNHHRLFNLVNVMTHGMFWWNALLLMWVSFIPFPTAVLGDYPATHIASVLYGAVMAGMALTFSLIRMYLSRRPGLLTPQTSIAEFKKGTVYSILFGPVLYLAGALFSFVHPFVSFGIFLAIPVYFIFPHATQDSDIAAGG